MRASAIAGMLVSLLAAPLMAASAQPAFFEGDGEMCLTALPASVQVTPGPNGIGIVASGETLSGEVGAIPELDVLDSAPVHIIVTRETAQFDFAAGEFSGRISGVISVADMDGRFSGTVSGTFSAGSYEDLEELFAAITGSSAEVSWNLRGDGRNARGRASASFSGPPEAFCGPLAMGGTVAGAGN